MEYWVREGAHYYMALCHGADGYVGVCKMALQVSKNTIHIIGGSGGGCDFVQGRGEDALEDYLTPKLLEDATIS